MSGNLAVSTINGVDISVSPVATESKLIGVGQTWQDVTGSRVLGTTYTNSTGKPIYLLVNLASAMGNGHYTLDINGIERARGAFDLAYTCYLQSIINNGDTYKVYFSANAGTLTKWSELR